MFLDPMYFVIVGPAILLSIWAGWKVKSTFNKYNQIPVASRISGAEVARLVLNRNGLDLPVEEHPGQLSDHYDPRVQKLRLSSEVFHGRSIGAVGVAAHEAGHALQHAKNYGPLHLRQAIAPVAGFASNISFWVILGGLFLGFAGLVKVGIVLFASVVAFQLVTLPVELNASARAKQMVYDFGIVTETERDGVSRVLSAAAMTYVAGALAGIMTLLYFIGLGDD